jgi:ATP-dependent RNA helicase SUPV3L1/SUV3
VASLDRVDGDIDTLTDRIAAIRIWTYIAHRASWLADPDHWRELSRAVEDRLSDALHERLAQRFVDARTTHLVRRLKAREQLHAQVSAEGEVSVEGHFIGHLEGFRFIADETQGKTAGRAVTSAALRALSGEIARRADALAAAGDPEFTLGDDGRLAWRGWDLARLTRGAHILKPRIRLLHTDLLAGTMRDRMTHRLAAWLEQHLEGCLAPIFRARAQPLEGAARGIVYQLAENLGPLTRRRAARQLAALESDDHAKLRRLGVRLGRRVIYLPGLIKPGPARLAALLWAIHAGMEELPPLPPAGRVSAPLPGDVPEGYLEAAGYLALGTLAVRVDIVERLLGKLRSVSAAGGNVIGADLLNLAGCTRAEMATLLVALDYQTRETENGLTFAPPRPAKRKRGRKPGGGGAEKTASPFAKLKDIALPT